MKQVYVLTEIDLNEQEVLSMVKVYATHEAAKEALKKSLEEENAESMCFAGFKTNPRENLEIVIEDDYYFIRDEQTGRYISGEITEEKVH